MDGSARDGQKNMIWFVAANSCSWQKTNNGCKEANHLKIASNEWIYVVMITVSYSFITLAIRLDLSRQNS